MSPKSVLFLSCATASAGANQSRGGILRSRGRILHTAISAAEDFKTGKSAGAIVAELCPLNLHQGTANHLRIDLGRQPKGGGKDRNGMDLTEAEAIKKRWQEYTEELYKKDLNDPDNHNGVVTHLEPDVLECEVKWALGSITMNKASGGDGIPVELFQILKDDAVKVLHSIC